MFEVKATQHVLAVNDLERTEQYFLGELGFSLRFRSRLPAARRHHFPTHIRQAAGMREFGVATPEGHRIVFGLDMQSGAPAL